MNRLAAGMTLSGGEFDSAAVCLPESSEGYIIYVIGGDEGSASEVSWTLFDESGNTVMDGSVGTSATCGAYSVLFLSITCP